MMSFKTRTQMILALLFVLNLLCGLKLFFLQRDIRQSNKLLYIELEETRRELRNLKLRHEIREKRF